MNVRYRKEGKEGRKGKERKGKERKGKERKGRKGRYSLVINPKMKEGRKGRM
jgi:hypothetical protein